jgi:hypothetical protein
LSLDSRGHLRFTPEKQIDSLPVKSFAHVRFPAGQPSALRAALLVQVSLHDGQRLTGQLLDLDEQGLTLRTVWSEKIALPRPAVAAVTHFPGWRPLAVADWENNSKTWKIRGNPTFRADKQGTSVLLKKPGQAVELTLSVPLEAGRVGVNFQEMDAPAGAHWRLEAAFRGGAVLRVTLAGMGNVYDVETVGLEGTKHTVARSPGPHRLTVPFSPNALSVLGDEAVLWHNLDRGPGGVLLRVRLECLARDQTPAQGEVAFSEFGLARQVDEPRRPPGDVDQDEVWLANGDQVFGQIRRADPKAIALGGHFGNRSFSWAEVHGLSLRRAAWPPRPSEGAHVRLLLWPAAGAEPDLVDGVLAGLDRNALTLRHNFLGEVKIPRSQVKQLDPLFHGRRQEIDNGFHHLGDPARLFPALQPARAEGPNLRQTVTLATAPGEARLVVRVTHLEGEGTTRTANGPRTEVVVNGRMADYLERGADRVAGAVRRLVVPLPRGVLRTGTNVIELRQPVGRRGPCVVAGLTLEMPEDD